MFPRKEGKTRVTVHLPPQPENKRKKRCPPILGRVCPIGLPEKKNGIGKRASAAPANAGKRKGKGEREERMVCSGRTEEE